MNNVPRTGVISQKDFYTKLEAFLDSPIGSRYKNDFVFRDDGPLEAVRLQAKKVYSGNNSADITILDGIRSALSKAGFGTDELGNEKAFTFVFQDLFTEQYRALPKEIAISLTLSSLVVGIVCAQLVGHPLVAVICVFVLGMVVVDILGFLYFTGVNLNSV